MQFPSESSGANLVGWEQKDKHTKSFESRERKRKFQYNIIWEKIIIQYNVNLQFNIGNKNKKYPL